MSRQRNVVTLDFFHLNADLRNDVSFIPWETQFIQIKGCEKIDRHGRALGGHYETSRCSFVVDGAALDPVHLKIERALAVLTHNQNTVSAISNSGGRVRFLVGWFCDEITGDSFSDSLLKRMGDLSISLDLMIYPPSSSLEIDAGDLV